MDATPFDPEGSIDKATTQLHLNLIRQAQQQLVSNQPDQALALYFRAYALKPGATHALHSVATVYDSLGDADSATACRRGVIPESAETQFFSAKHHARRIKPARRASNSQHIKTHRHETVTLQAPRSNCKPGLRPAFRAVRTRSLGSFVNTITNGGVWFDGFNTVVTDSKGDILQEHIKGNPYVVADTARQRPENFIAATVCFIDARSSPLYYHWMIDVLPKFALLQQAGISINDIDYFIVRCNSSFQKETLERLGVSTDRVIAPWSEGVTRCTNLIVPYLKHDTGERFYNGLGMGMARWVPGWLKSSFVTPAELKGTRLYLSRSVRGTRCLVDEDKLIVSLQQRGFEHVTLETMSVSQQATLLAGAHIVVSPHGAGLSNIAFCQPGTTIVEIFGHYVEPCYWVLSELAGLDYHAFFGDNQGEDTASKEHAHRRAATHKERRNQDIDLDIDSLLAYIDPLLETSASPPEKYRAIA